jgi:hypothetical protein
MMENYTHIFASILFSLYSISIIMPFDVVDDTYENSNIDQSLDIENEFTAMDLENMINDANEFIEQSVKELPAEKTLDSSELITSIVVKNTNVDETLSLSTVELLNIDLPTPASSASNAPIIELPATELPATEFPATEPLATESLVIKPPMSTAPRTARKAPMSSVNLVKKASNKRASKPSKKNLGFKQTKSLFSINKKMRFRVRRK